MAFRENFWVALVSQLNTQRMVSPVNASRQPSRTAAYHSGPERLATLEILLKGLVLLRRTKETGYGI